METLRILLLAANPVTTDDLAIEREFEQIEAALKKSDSAGIIELFPIIAATPQDLLDALNKYTPNVLHFSGHGDSSGEIFLVDERGEAVPVKPDILRSLLNSVRETLRFVVLNACYSEEQAEAIVEVIDCAIGIPELIADADAIQFASALYSAIGYGLSILTGFEQARALLQINRYPETSLPRLRYRRGTDPASLVLLDALVLPEAANDRKFSEPIVERFKQLGQTIQALTHDQFVIISWLHGVRRAAIAGCAGSGKTLVAAEKAIRLDRAGLKTLVLCHNPHLAAFIRSLMTGTGIEVYDFASWIGRYLGQQPLEYNDWTYHYEPTDAELDTAFDAIARATPSYEAIIVDEGQDFRDTWWALVEAALDNPQKSILYVFHDDNQALLPMRAKYPITQAPMTMSKNCRNAGEIFRVVRVFHPQAPEPSLFLEGSGVVEETPFDFESSEPFDFGLPYNIGFDSQGLKVILAQAIISALRYLKPQQLVILTTEPDPVHKSLLYGLPLEYADQIHWQRAVNGYLSIMSNAPRLPNLSHSLRPTDADIRAVVEFASNANSKGERTHRQEYLRRAAALRWELRADRLFLVGQGVASPMTLKMFFEAKTWADSMPTPKQLYIGNAANSVLPRRNLVIPLYTVTTFKGLESDGVILFIDTKRSDLRTQLYVGLSRAKFYVNVVSNAELGSLLSSLERRVER